MVSSDSAGNVSDLSNVLDVTTAAPDLTAPAAVNDLSASDIGPTALTLTWTATGDDGTTGTAAAYDIRYSTGAIVDEASFAAAQPVAGVPVPVPAGGVQTVQVPSLTPDTQYYFAIEVTDDAGNVSALSNVLACDDAAAGYNAAGCGRHAGGGHVCDVISHIAFLGCSGR